MIKTAVLSECRKYRYTLHRVWYPHGRYCAFIGLNPSTANETEDDPTIRRCINFAQYWGYGGVIMLNLFALRATNPKDMLKHSDPIGPNNDGWIQTVVNTLKKTDGIVVAAWGTNGYHLNRDKNVVKGIENLKCLKITKDGFPGHPLYLPKDSKLINYP